MPDRILIWGAGAIGGTIGAALVKAGHDVTFVDVEAAHVAAIKDPARGLQISGPVLSLKAVAPAFTPAQVVGEWDHIYLAVKAQHTREAAQALLPHMTAGGTVLSLQNGLCEPIIAGIVGHQRVLGAFINYSADWNAPGDILFANRGAFVIGELDGAMTPRLDATLRTVRDFEPDAIATTDINAYLWGKLGYGTLLFAQAVGQLGIADCLARPELLPLWREFGAEVNAVAAKRGIVPKGFNGYDPAAFAPGASEAAASASVDAMVAFNRPSLKTHSGVWRDLAIRKRRTEVDVQIAPIAAIGAELGIDCPAIRALVAMIHEVEGGRRSLSDDNLLELAKL